MLLQLSQFFPLSLSSPSPSHPLWAIPQLLFFIRVHGSCVQVLWLLYFLYCTLHPCSYSVTTNFHFLIPSPLHSFSPESPVIWQPSKHSLYLWFCLCSSCLLSLLFRFSYWLTCIFCNCIVHSFDLIFLKQVPLTFHIIMVWWRWTPLVFSCLGRSLSALQF